MYLLDNAAHQTAERFDALAAIFDPGTKRHISARGLTRGWSCLEVGAGGGSIARWLAKTVSPGGRVLATDIDTRYLRKLESEALHVLRHDVSAEPFPSAAFDLVHARLVLMHIADSAAALQRMIDALKPGGWLIVEDFSVSPERPLRSIAAVRGLMAGGGADVDGGHTLPRRLRGAGLVEVDAEARAFMWSGGSPGARMMSANIDQLGAALVSAGLVTPDVIASDRAILNDPAFVMHSPVMWAAWGRRVV